MVRGGLWINLPSLYKPFFFVIYLLTSRYVVNHITVKIVSWRAGQLIANSNFVLQCKLACIDDIINDDDDDYDDNDNDDDNDNVNNTVNDSNRMKARTIMDFYYS